MGQQNTGPGTLLFDSNFKPKFFKSLFDTFSHMFITVPIAMNVLLKENYLQEWIYCIFARPVTPEMYMYMYRNADILA